MQIMNIPFMARQARMFSRQLAALIGAALLLGGCGKTEEAQPPAKTPPGQSLNPAKGLQETVNAGMRTRTALQAQACVANLKQIDGAKEIWAAENKKKTGDPVSMADLAPKYIKTEPKCPEGNAPYIVNALGKNPQCPHFKAGDEILKLHTF